MTLPPCMHLGSTERFQGEKGRRERESPGASPPPHPQGFALGFLAQAKFCHDSSPLECFVSQSLIRFKPLRSEDNSPEGTGRRITHVSGLKIKLLGTKRANCKRRTSTLVHNHLEVMGIFCRRPRSVNVLTLRD